MSPTPSPLRRHAVNLLKTTLAGASIALFAWGFLTLNPAGDVEEIQAEIVDFSLFTPQTSTQKFVTALDRLGHEKPRVYNYNGTQIFFSTRTTPKRPQELILEYQEELVAQGVNSRVWDVTPDRRTLQSPELLEKASQERTEAMLKGELQVLYHDEGHVIMSGAELRDDKIMNLLFTPPETEGGKPTLHLNDFDKLFKLHRYVEAEWDPIQKSTTVTATWGDEAFDISKTLPTPEGEAPSLTHNATDLEVPACIGCFRLTRFATEANDKPYVKQIFSSQDRPEAVAHFYQQAMTNRGWKPTELALPEEKLSDDPEAQLLQFSRGTRFVTITIHPDDDGSGSMVSAIATD